MWRFPLLIIVLVGSLAACTPLVGQQAAAEAQRAVYPPAAFTHRVGTTQIVLYWDCLRPEPGLLRLDGVAHSPYVSEVRFLKFELVGVDAADRTVSEAKGAARDFLLRTNQISPFQIDLRTTGSEARFDLFYQYQAAGSLRSMLAGAGAESPLLLAQVGTRFLARDVCSETQHRIPKTTW